ncbi:MAG TPA: serine O-acetyltransferase [Thermoflexales bacterium]|nr:serine O-acetyltransferase [Thermoflexales bacterium]HQZ22608.1 serine O-acetyltransferase [Thermoflexales bacterium]
MADIDIEQLAEQLHRLHRGNLGRLPNKKYTDLFLDTTLELIFPNIIGDCEPDTQVSVREQLEVAEEALEFALTPLQPQDRHHDNDVIHHFFHHRLPSLIDDLWLDAQAMYEGDPAARSVDEVICAYPGLMAVSAYRIAHEFYALGVPIFPRMITEIAHSRTGIDIHPGAVIGSSFCIDHGTGIVIGETAQLGDHVKLYQGVTLGALSVEKQMAQMKRHPTIEDHVVIYANATILGGETVIGHHSVIGGNVWLTESVQPNSMVYHRGDIRLKQREMAQADEALLRWFPQI